MPIGTLAIDRFRIAALVPGDHAAPDRIRGKLDAVNEGTLESALARRLGAPFVGWDDDRVILLRRVALDLSGGGSVDAAGLADRLAAMLVIALARAIEMPGENVVLFASWAAYLAAFLGAAIRNEAWDKWWFSRFDGLKLLPLSACLRTALLRDIDVGLQALMRLGATEQAQVLAALSPADVREILAVIEVDRPTGAFVAALAATARQPAGAPGTSVEHATLHWFLAALAAAPTLPRGDLLQAAEMLAAVEALDIEQKEIVARYLREGRVGPLVRILVPADIAALAPLFAGWEIARHIVADRLDATAATAEPPAARFTAFGGLLLLAPSLPQDCGSEIALAALAACAGPQAAMALADPMLQRVLGASERDTMTAIGAKLRQLDDTGVAELAALGTPPAGRDQRWFGLPRALRRNTPAYRAVVALGHAAQRELARRLPGFADASAAFLWENVLSCGAHVTPEEDGFRAVLERPPLDVLLSMTGLADRACELPGGRTLRLERAR
jgi:hypothetical protein